MKLVDFGTNKIHSDMFITKLCTNTVESYNALLATFCTCIYLRCIKQNNDYMEIS